MNLQREAAVGALVLIAIALFVGGALWLQGKSPGKDDVYVIYNDISTLKDASSVRISGAPVGRVDGIEYLAPGRIVVGIKFTGHDRPRIRVTDSAHAEITGVGMLGDMMIVLNPGNGAPLARGDTIHGTLTKGVFDKAADLAGKAQETMTRINAMLDTTLVLDLRRTLRSAQQMMAYYGDRENGPAAQLNPTMLAFQKTASRLDSTLAQVDPGKLQTRLDSTMRSAGGAADRIAAMTARTDSLMAKIQRGDGTFGKLMNDSSFYGDMRKTMQSMTDLINEIKKNPGKIGVTVRIP